METPFAIPTDGKSVGNANAKKQMAPMEPFVLNRTKAHLPCRILPNCAILSLLPFSNLATERRCQALEILTSIFVAVAAGVISHYICKWLDGHGKGK